MTLAATRYYTRNADLEHQGTKFIERFDALCYVRLTQMLDTHDIGMQPAVTDAAMSPRPLGGHLSVLASMRQPTFVLGIDSDVLYPVRRPAKNPKLRRLSRQRSLRRGGTSSAICDIYVAVPPPRTTSSLQLHTQQEIASYMPNAVLHVISSPHGHDSFLIEIAQVNDALRSWLRHGDDKVKAHL